MFFDEETENEIDGLAEEFLEAVRDERLVFYEGCTIVTAPTGAPPEYITVMVDGINDPNVYWRGTPATPAVGQEVLVWHNPYSDRREIIGASGATGVTGGASWCQKVVVAVCGGDFTTLGAAVTWINALPAAQSPSATRLYAINVLGGTFVEAANVTIPQYVDVSGEGESSVVNLGAFSLLMSDDSSLLDLTVKSSNASYAIAAVGKDSVVLRNVHCIQTGVAGTPDCFHISAGSTNVRVYDCVAEIPANGVGFHVIGASEAVLHTCIVLSSAKDATTYGFQVGDTANALLDYCTADDDAHFNDALHLDDTALTCVTRWCTFRAYDNDVNVAGTTPDWYHLDCHLDPDNSIVAAGTHTALPTKRFNRCVIVAVEGGDFQTLAEAVAWVNAVGPPASGTEYTVKVLGRTTEAGDVLIPNWCHVEAETEGVVVNMQGNRLRLCEDTSLTHLTVTGTAASEVVEFVTKYDGQIIRDCHIENTGTGHAVFAEKTGGTSYIYDSTLESADADGLHLTSDLTYSTTVIANNCRISGGDDGVHLVNDDCTLYTEYCILSGTTNDVNLAAGTWYHLKCGWDANNSTLVGTETPLQDGAVEIHSTAIRGHSSLYPDLGTTTLAQKLGDVYLARCYDVYPDHDVYGLWTRAVNFGVTCPDEHWHQNADELAWIGWAAYVGYATPNSIAHSNSQKRVQHNAATHAFYYRAAATGDDILLRQGVSMRVGSANTVHAGIMIDDGVDAADGNGANNYYRVMVESTALITNWNIRREYRVGGGAPAAAVTAYSLQPGDFYCPVLIAKPNPDWANWWAGMYYRRSNAYESLVQFDNPPFTWTPARVGLYYYISAASAGHGIWDWYDEDTS